jgi:serine protease Do
MRGWVGAVLMGVIVLAAEGAPVDDSVYKLDSEKRIRQLLNDRQCARGAFLRSQLTRRHAGLLLPTPSQARLTPAEVYNLWQYSVVVVVSLSRSEDRKSNDLGNSTGFAVADGGVIATNYHCVSNPGLEALGVMTRDGKMHAVQEVLAADKDSDVAILRTSATHLKPIPLATGAETGAHVTCIGHPDGLFYTLTAGIVSRRYLQGGVEWLAVTTDYAKGSSGSPILDEFGNAVGMVSALRFVYFNVEDRLKANPQMVMKTCVPAEPIKAAASPGSGR